MDNRESRSFKIIAFVLIIAVSAAGIFYFAGRQDVAAEDTAVLSPAPVTEPEPVTEPAPAAVEEEADTAEYELSWSTDYKRLSEYGSCCFELVSFGGNYPGIAAINADLEQEYSAFCEMLSAGDYESSAMRDCLKYGAEYADNYAASREVESIWYSDRYVSIAFRGKEYMGWSYGRGGIYGRTYDLITGSRVFPDSLKAKASGDAQTLLQDKLQEYFDGRLPAFLTYPEKIEDMLANNPEDVNFFIRGDLLHIYINRGDLDDESAGSRSFMPEAYDIAVPLSGLDTGEARGTFTPDGYPYVEDAAGAVEPGWTTERRVESEYGDRHFDAVVFADSYPGAKKINKRQEQLYAEFIENSKGFDEAYESQLETEMPSLAQNFRDTLDIEYIWSGGKYATVFYAAGYYYGGAHGSVFRYAVTFNLDTGEELKVSALTADGRNDTALSVLKNFIYDYFTRRPDTSSLAVGNAEKFLTEDRDRVDIFIEDDYLHVLFPFGREGYRNVFYSSADLNSFDNFSDFDIMIPLDMFDFE